MARFGIFKGIRSTRGILPLDGAVVLTTSTNRSISSPSDLVIGRDNPVRLSFNGEIGEVRIWNTTLTDQMISSNIDTDYTGTEPDLAGLWNMNTKEDGIITDLVSKSIAALGSSVIGDNSEPQWTLNTTCGFSMFRGPDNSVSNSSRIKEFIINAKPASDSIVNEKAAQLKSFPNPSSSQETTLYVKSESNEELTLEIVDSFGNLVHTSSGHRTNESLKIVTPWKPGVYIVRARSKTGIYESKMVKL